MHSKGSVNDSYFCLRKSESHSVVSNSLWPHGLYSPWNFPGQNTEVDTEYWSGILKPIPSLWDFSQPRDWTRSQALQADFFFFFFWPAEPQGKPCLRKEGSKEGKGICFTGKKNNSSLIPCCIRWEVQVITDHWVWILFLVFC